MVVELKKLLFLLPILFLLSSNLANASSFLPAASSDLPITGIGALIGSGLGYLLCGQKLGGGGLIGGTISAVASAIGTVACIGVITTLTATFMPLILLTIIIIFFEFLVRFNYNELSNLISALGKLYKNGISILPSSSSSEANDVLIKMQSPFKLFININRGLLYTAWIFIFLNTFGMNFITGNTPAFGLVFSFINVIVEDEPLFLMVLFSVAIVDALIDLAGTLVSYVRD